MTKIQKLSRRVKKDTARYASLLLAPGEGFGLQTRFFFALWAKKELFMMSWRLLWCFGNFWCRLVTVLTFSSNISKKKQKSKKNKKNQKKSKNAKKSKNIQKKILKKSKKSIKKPQKSKKCQKWSKNPKIQNNLKKSQNLPFFYFFYFLKKICFVKEKKMLSS